MKTLHVAVAIAAMFAGVGVAQAQTMVQPAVGVATPSVGSVLRVGTEVPLKLSEELTTKGKKLKTGYRFHLEVAENVLVADRIVIPAGTPAFGEVTDVRNKGMWGKSGHLNARVLYAMVNDRQIRLTGNFDDKRVTGTAGVVGAIAFVPVAGLFTTGTSARLPVGTPVKAFVNEDVPPSFDAPAPAAMAVSTGVSQ